MEGPAFLVAGLLCLPPVAAEVALDGSLGPAATLAGPEYRIDAALGRQAGGNLFHSFHAFDLGVGESAHFTGPAGIRNVVGRVTGGAVSTINGAIHNHIPGAGLTLVNPAGVLFGPLARLHVDAAFLVSTADYVELEDGARFYADPVMDSGLTSAPISAFGFLDAPAPIGVDDSVLKVGDGAALGLVGGGLTVKNAALQAAGGNIVLVAAGSPGQVTVAGEAPRLEGFAAMERVRIEHTRPDRPGGEPGLANVDVSGESAGRIWIRGGALEMDGGSVFADTRSDSGAAGVDIRVDGVAGLRNNSLVTAENLGSGAGGHVQITAGVLVINGSSRVSTTNFGDGNAGSIKLSVGNLDIGEAGSLASNTVGRGRGGDLLVSVAGRLRMAGAGSGLIADSGAADGGQAGSIRIQAREFEIGSAALVQSASGGAGDAGTIELHVDRLEVVDGGRVSTASTGGTGDGGDILVAAGHSVRVSGSAADGSRSAIIANSVGRGRGDAGEVRITVPLLLIEKGGLVQSTTDGAGHAGAIELDLDRLLLRHGGEIATTAVAGTGNGGEIRIHAREQVRLEGGAAGPTGIAANTGADGDAGSIEIAAPLLVMTQGGRIQSLTEGGGDAGSIRLLLGRLAMDGGAEVSTSTLGSGGRGGNLRVEAGEEVLIRGNTTVGPPTGLFSNAGPAATGNAGRVQVVTPRLTLQDAGIQSQTGGDGDAGTIVLQVGELRLLDGGQISTSTNIHGSGRGGDILLDAGSVRISGRNAADAPSAIVADSRSSSAPVTGAAGRVRIRAGVLEVERGGRIVSSTSSGGDAGSIDIEADAVLLRTGGAISSATSAGGRGGSVRVAAADLAIDGRGAEPGSTGLFSDTSGSNTGGRILLLASTVLVAQRGVVSCRSSGGGDAGDIDVHADELLLVSGALTTQSDATSGGNIRVTAGSSRLLGTGQVTASVLGSRDTQGGNVRFRGDSLVILDAGRVTATATRGLGGYILVNNGVFLHDPDAASPVLDASSETLGNSGIVEVNSPDLDISGSLAALRAVFLDASHELNRRCGVAAAGRRSSLLVRGRERGFRAPVKTVPRAGDRFPPP